ncbi:MAG: ATP synthase F1 subunit gamma [Patescibacteria group bacterium]|nr:ATP synthase F1 subunit gamma [Patescibacteria group bacterium]
MASLKTIQLKRRSVCKSRQVTRAMEAVSAAKMRKAQAHALRARAYARAALSVLARLSSTRELARHSLVRQNDSAHMLYIVITSDKGLAGALNSAVLKAAAADIASRGEARIIAVGRKAGEYFVRRGFPVELSVLNLDSHDRTARAVLERASKLYAAGDVGVVRIAYQNFVSTFEQRPTVRTLFPLSLTELNHMVEDLNFAKTNLPGEKSGPQGRRERQADETGDPRTFQEGGLLKPITYTVEPSEAEVLEAVVPRLASVAIHHALRESAASEHSARMVAMKSATDKADELSVELTRRFNKARQAAITRELSEIVGGMEALSI